MYEQAPENLQRSPRAVCVSTCQSRNVLLSLSLLRTFPSPNFGQPFLETTDLNCSLHFPRLPLPPISVQSNKSKPETSSNAPSPLLIQLHKDEHCKRRASCSCACCCPSPPRPPWLSNPTLLISSSQPSVRPPPSPPVPADGARAASPPLSSPSSPSSSPPQRGSPLSSPMPIPPGATATTSVPPSPPQLPSSTAPAPAPAHPRNTNPIPLPLPPPPSFPLSMPSPSTTSSLASPAPPICGTEREREESAVRGEGCGGGRRDVATAVSDPIDKAIDGRLQGAPLQIFRGLLVHFQLP